MSAGPLSGLQVVELAGIGPGPFCAMLLADLGARVLRVDRPGAPSRQARQQLLNRGRQSVIVDLKRPEGTEVLLALVSRADVLLEGMRPGVTERLGIGPEECMGRNPGLVYARMTGWGQAGPLAATAGHDIDYIARTGALHMIGRAGGPPQVPLNLVGDFGGGGMLLAFGICAALWERQRSGLGQVIDAAVIDGTAALLAQAWGARAAGQWRDERGVNRLDTGLPWYDVFETRDGQWLAVGALEPRFWAEFTRILALAELPDRDDPARREELRAVIAARFRERTRSEWEEAFAGSDACVAPVLSMTEATRDPHVTARQTYRDEDGVIQPAPAPRFSRTPGSLGQPPPLPGEHTREALAEWGIEDLDGLIAAGVVQEAPT
jgi:alpha-methylacyl-CoA racemase